jgi:hypothetical protein
MKLKRVFGWMFVVGGLFTFQVAVARGGPENLQVDQVTGEVTAQKTTTGGWTPLQPFSRIGTGGELRTGLDGSLYATVMPGARLHLAAGSDLKIRGMVDKTQPDGTVMHCLDLGLLQGKITFSLSPATAGHFCYQVHTLGGRVAGVDPSLCVICLHGDGAHLYVAKGYVIMYPKGGPYSIGGIKLVAKAAIGVLGNQGTLDVIPMNRIAPSTANCLLSGAAPAVANQLETAQPNPANTPTNPPVSETE